MPNWKDEFKNPSSEFRSMIFWVWNGDMSENKITDTLEQFKKVGIGGGHVLSNKPYALAKYMVARKFDSSVAPQRGENILLYS